MSKVYIVATVQDGASDDDGGDVFADIIGVYSTRRKANAIAKKLENEDPIPGLNYAYLTDYKAVTILERTMDQAIKNKE